MRYIGLNLLLTLTLTLTFDIDCRAIRQPRLFKSDIDQSKFVAALRHKNAMQLYGEEEPVLD